MTSINSVPTFARNSIVLYGLFLSACAVAFLAIRHFWVMTPEELYIMIARANIMALSFSLPFSVFAFLQIRPTGFKAALGTGATAGLFGASLCTIVIGGEIAQGVHKAIPEYWDWWRDWPEFIFKIVGIRAVIGAGIGAATTTICWFGKGKLTKP